MEKTKTIGRRLSIPKLKKDNRTLSTMVYEHIRKEIICGTLKWGERLSEDFLARSFNVSRTPIREAVFQLVQEGLVTKQPHNCFHVREFSQAEIEEIFRLRSILESLIVELLVEKIADSAIAELRENLDRCQTLLQKGDIGQLLPLITEFHEILYRAADSPKLQDILHGLGGDMLLNRYLAVQKEGVVADFIDHHQQLLDALEAKDKPRAEEIMKEHLEEGRNCALEIIGYESSRTGRSAERAK